MAGAPAYLKDYINVADRLAMAHAEGWIKKITTTEPIMFNTVMGYVRCTIEFTDGSSATATGTFRTDAKFGAQMTNPIEDAETSAIGRALAFLGVDTKRQKVDIPTPTRRSIASADEIYVAKMRETGHNIASMQTVQTRVIAMRDKVIALNRRIDHDLAALPVEELSYDELVTYGRYLKSLLPDKPAQAPQTEE